MKQYALIIMALMSIGSENIFCMDSIKYELVKTILLPEQVKTVHLGSYCNNVVYVVPGKIHTDSFANIFPSKTFDYDASCISFDDFSSHLGLITVDNTVKIVDVVRGSVKTLSEQSNSKYTVLQCGINGNECIVGSDLGKLWRLKYNKHPRLLENCKFTGTSIPSMRTCLATQCSLKGSLYAAAMNDQFAGCAMLFGSVKTTKVGWRDNTSPVTDICFSRDGSLVAFSASNYVMVYVTALLEKYKQIMRENNNIASSEPVRKQLKGMMRASLFYGKMYVDTVDTIVFHDDNKHIFAGMRGGKVYCCKIKQDSEPKEVVDFGKNIQSLAYSNQKLAIAGLDKADLYFLSQA